MCGDTQGIYGSTPTDIMHVLQLGIMKYCLTILFDALSTNQRQAIDCLAINLKQCNRQSTRKHYPRAALNKGLTDLTNITAEEITGAVFITSVLLQSDDGWHILDKATSMQTQYAPIKQRKHSTIS